MGAALFPHAHPPAMAPSSAPTQRAVKACSAAPSDAPSACVSITTGPRQAEAASPWGVSQCVHSTLICLHAVQVFSPSPKEGGVVTWFLLFFLNEMLTLRAHTEQLSAYKI